MFRTDRVAGSVDVSVPIYVVDSTTGTPETDWDFEEEGIDLWYRRAGGAKVSITEAMQTVNGAHVDGGVVHISDGRGRLDLPDAACAVGVPYVEYGGTIPGMVVYGGIVQLQDPVAGLFQSFAIGSTGNTTTTLNVSALGALADDELNGELIWVMDVSANEWHPAWVTDYTASSDIATVISAQSGGALPFTPEASVDRVARSGITRAQFTIPWNNAWDAEVQSEAADALNAYDPPTRAELTSDIGTVTAILGALNTAASSGAVGTTTTIVAYLKQIINTLEGAPGIPTWPAAAAPGNSVSIAEAIRYIYDQIGVAGAGLTNINLPNQTMDITGNIIGNITGNLSGSVGSVTAGVTLADDAITAAKFDESTAFPLRSNNLNLSAAAIITGTAVTGTLTTTTATTNLTGYADDQLIGRVLVVTSGDAKGEATDITDYAEANGTLTFTALTTPMSNGDTFVIL